MYKIYITKIQVALMRVLSNSEISKAKQFFESGKSVIYAIEYFR